MFAHVQRNSCTFAYKWIGMRALPDIHPHTSAHAHSCRLPHPAEPDLCLAPVLHPPVSVLISSTAEEVLQETTPKALCSDLAGVWAISSRRLASGCSPEHEERKQKTPTPTYSWLWLVSSVTPEKCPSEVFKSMQPLKTTTWL